MIRPVPYQAPVSLQRQLEVSYISLTTATYAIHKTEGRGGMCCPSLCSNIFVGNDVAIVGQVQRRLLLLFVQTIIEVRTVLDFAE